MNRRCRCGNEQWEFWWTDDHNPMLQCGVCGTLYNLHVLIDASLIELKVEEDDPADNTLWFLSDRRLIYNRHPDAIISGDAFPAYKLEGHVAHGKAGGDR